MALDRPHLTGLDFQPLRQCLSRVSRLQVRLPCTATASSSTPPPAGRPAAVFGDQTVTSAMIDRIVHDADVLSLNGTSYRLKSHQPVADTG
nr:ATP-binding protein [Cryobacterium sp. TMS1-13-1]